MDPGVVRCAAAKRWRARKIGAGVTMGGGYSLT